MKNRKFFQDAIENIDLRDEERIRTALQEKGLYSKSNIFPIASLQFELTSHCNMKCKHCYNNSGANNNTSEAMTSSQWISFAKYLVKLGGIFECLISGGEPLLLGDALFELMDVLHEDGTLFMLLTNGYLMTKNKAQQLRKYRYHWLQLSIDGTNENYHDTFRQKKGSWKKAIEAAQMISQNGIPLKIAHCVTPYNLHDIDNMCKLAHSLGASGITVGELCLSGRSSYNRDLFLSNEQKALLMQKVNENYFRYKGIMRVKTSNSVRAGLERHKKSPRSEAVIRPNGDIRIDGMAPFIVGNVLSDDFSEIWKSKIDIAWKHPKVEDFIAKFDETDKNLFLINYVDEDIYI